MSIIITSWTKRYTLLILSVKAVRSTSHCSFLANRGVAVESGKPFEEADMFVWVVDFFIAKPMIK